MANNTPADAPLRPAALGKALLQSARPWQWYKNFVIYTAFFFTLNEAWALGDLPAAAAMLARLTLAFILFLLLATAVYLLNDIIDAESDRLHARKRRRPVASGRLPLPLAWTSAAIASAIALAGATLLSPQFALVACAYALINIAYTLLLKRIVLVDIFVISSGMVLRVIAGAVIMQVPISPWLYLCTALVALMLALVKRRSQLAANADLAIRQRATLGSYTLASLNQLIDITAATALIAYSLYTFTAPNLPPNNAMMITIPLVAFGVFRYILLASTSDKGEDPERLLISDRPLIAALLLWIAAALAILLLFRP